MKKLVGCQWHLMHLPCQTKPHVTREMKRVRGEPLCQVTITKDFAPIFRNYFTHIFRAEDLYAFFPTFFWGSDAQR